jgi:DNA-binding MarR family transcriptional regulator
VRDARPDTRAGLLADLHEVTFRMMRVQRQIAERAFAPLGLRPVQAFALALLGHEASYPKELAHLLDAPPSVISVLLADLEGRGLLSRAVDPDDRRRVRLELTPEGHRTLDAVYDAWLDANADRLARLSTADLETLVRIQKALLEE